LAINEKHGSIKCWTYFKCGRIPGGAKEKELGICPAYPDNGRFCWHIAGTLCKGQVQGTFAQKKKSCFQCEFFQLVQKEEGEDFQIMVT
jgi:hypothetical protein